MNGEIICVGTELLLGNIVNTNARFLSEELAALGINVYNQSVVGDNEQRIKQELSAALKRSNLIILTGGLGPTADDMTKECVASYFSLNLTEDYETRAQIEAYFKRTGRTMTQSNYKQALFPKGSYIFKNDVGTAPGCAIEHGGNTVIILPGPPSEMEYMFKKYVKPYLEKKSDTVIVSHKVRIFGESESKVESQIKHLTKLHNPTVAPYANEGEMFLRVTAKAKTALAADSLCKPVIANLTDILGDSVYGVDCDDIQSVVVKMLKEKKLKIATAESCTAGMLSAMITEVAGSSEIFEFGISAYANRVKVNALGVPEEVINKYGAVSEHTAAYMAMGVRKMSGADLGIGITGVAGPGASESKPVGLVYIALADRHNVWIRKTTLGHGSSEREKVRRNSAKTALDLARRYLCSLPETLEGGFAIGSVPKVLTEQPPIFKKAAVKPTFTANPTASTNFTDYELAQMINSVAQNDHYEPNTKEDALEYAKNQSDYISFAEDDFAYDEKPKKVSFFARKKQAAAPNDAYLTSVDAEKNEPTEIAKESKESGLKFRFMRFVKSLVPWKGDKIGEIIRKLVFIISLIALIISSLYMVNYFRESDAQSNIVEDVREAYESDSNVKNNQGVFLGFEAVLALNKDTKAWLTIPGTSVNDPVVLGEDNDFYLNHNFLKQKSRYGTLYFDKDNVITEDIKSQNLVIYGHEMKNGLMFGTLKRYKNANFYKENPIFTMRTLYDESAYKIFAIFITNASPEQDNGKVFEYRTPNFNSQEEFLAFTAQLKERSIINTGVDILEGDQLVTLSTCTGEFADARLVIVARRVRPDEKATVDITKVSVNENPRYPQAYYDKKKIENPYKYESSAPTVSSDTTVSSDEESTDLTSSADGVTSGEENASSDMTSSDMPSNAENASTDESSSATESASSTDTQN